MVSTRLWGAGTVNFSRERHLTDRMLPQVRACAQRVQALLVCTDGCHHAAGRLETLKARMYLIGCTCNFFWPHHELSKPHYAGHVR
jgi:hypothetical protein